MTNKPTANQPSQSPFKKAERILTNPTIALTGPTGSGKTFSALRLAKGICDAMGKRFAVIDTENGSASLYSDQFDFETLVFSPPFTTEKYIRAINAAEKEDFGALVIDSITHAWAGEGGLLEQKAQLDARPGSNHWTNWNPIKQKDLKFRNAYLHSSIPFLIATMRSKMEYAQSEDGGKKKIQKMGMAPVQSDGIEYEFSIVFDVAMNHEAEVSKDRTHLFSDRKILLIDESVGELLYKWRSEGKEVQKPQPPEQKPPSAPVAPPQSHPPIENQSFPPDDDMPNFDENYGDHLITFGKFKNQRIQDLHPNDIEWYLQWIEESAEKQNRPVTGAAAEFVFNAKEYLRQVDGPYMGGDQ